METGRQNANHGLRKTIHPNPASDHMGIGIEMLPPIRVAKNSHSIGFISGLLFCECGARSRDRLLGS